MVRPNTRILDADSLIARFRAGRSDRVRRAEAPPGAVALGKNGRRREIGMDAWGWKQLRPWLAARAELPVGPLFCVIDGPIRGRAWSSAAARLELHRLARQVAIRRRFAPHQLRHTHAVLAREGLALNIIQRQLGHANLGTTSIRCVR